MITQIEISSATTYHGQSMGWTEPKTGIEVADGEKKYFHYSDEKIDSFLTKETCFFDSQIVKTTDKLPSQDKYRKTEYVYAYIPEKGKDGVRYENEVRFHISENDRMLLVGEVRNYFMGYDYPDPDHRTKAFFVEY